MKHIKLVIAMVVISSIWTFANAQYKYDYQWVFGRDDATNPRSTILDFNHGSVMPISTSLKMDISWARGNICDKNGKLQYYTNSCFIADSSTFQIKNGGGLNPGQVHDGQCRGGYISHQSDLFIPAPGNSNLMYLFHKSLVYVRVPKVNIWADALRYTLIDNTKNDGLGQVIKKNVPIISDTSLTGDMITATRHKNLIDWWIISPNRDTNIYTSILLDSNGISDTMYQQIGRVRKGGKGGWIKFIPNGKQLVSYDPENNIFILDFDRSTGVLSNFKYVHLDGDSTIFGGIAVSSNNRFLYVCSAVDVWQFDLYALNIEASKIHIAHWDGFRDEINSPVSFLFMERGPDCRIYISPASSSRYMSIIHSPNLKGKDCDLEQHAIAFEHSKGHGLVHFPNYRLGYAPVCDSSIILTTSSFNPIPQALKVKITPNPVINELQIEIQEVSQYPISIKIFNLYGVEVLNTITNQSINYIDVSQFKTGIYICQFQGSNFVFGTKKITKL